MSYLAYIITSQHRSPASRLKGKLSGYPYTGAALSVDPELSRIFTFERRAEYSGLSGSLTVFDFRRYINRGDLPVRIYAMPLSDEEYKRLSSLLLRMEKNKEKYIYNNIESVTSNLEIPCRIPYAYTAVGFVSRALGLGRVKTVRALEFILSDYLIFEGKPSEIMAAAEAATDEDEIVTIPGVIADLSSSIGELSLRWLDKVFEKEGLYELLEDI